GMCGNGIVNGFEQCDGTAFSSNYDSTCVGNGFVSGTVSCRDDCTLNFAGCQAAVCGNGVVEGNEVCDGGSTACGGLGFAAGTATCKSDCTGYNLDGCSGIASCGNGRIDGPTVRLELCDGAAFASFGGGASASQCSTFNLGSGSVSCTSTCELNFSGCQSQDVCTAFNLRGNGQCDVCEAYGGAPDPDCDPSSATFGCGFDGECNDFFDNYIGEWACRAKGHQDPDCGFCGNGTRERGEYCDGDAFGNTTCADYGFTGGSLRCNADCVVDLSACTP
ncbi:MAG: hypothetical protein AAFQ82_08385, partial [Myxococcota bacterium]